MDLPTIPQFIGLAINVFKRLIKKKPKRDHKKTVKNSYSFSLEEEISYNSEEYKRSISIEGKSEFEDSDEQTDFSN